MTRGNNRRSTTRLHQHKPSPDRRQVRQPPLRQLPLREMRWFEDHVPNFLWAGGHVAADPDQGLFAIARVLDAMTEIAIEAGVHRTRETLLDGSLVGFEVVPPEIRRLMVNGMRSRGLADLAAPEGFVHAIRSYPGAPGSWLAEITTPDDLHADPELAERYLTSAVTAIALGGGPGATAVKAGAFRSLLVGGLIRFARDAVPADELMRYPNNEPAERGLVESFVRASFGAFAAMDDERSAQAAAWAARFWRANWSLFPCRGSDVQDTSQVVGDTEESSGDTPEPERFAELVSDIWDEFLRVAFTTDPDLYDPGRHEVISGLVAHGLRVALVVAAHPALWVGEFSAPLLRIVSEILVVLSWFGTPDGCSPDAHQRFKEFGRGRLKLLKLHAEEFSDRVGANPLLDDALASLHEEVNQEVGEEFQDVSLEATFTGRDLRKMALAANVEWVYRLELAPPSSILHSEWPALTRYALDPCANALHRFHWLPRRTLRPAVTPNGGEVAVRMAERLLDAYRALVIGAEADPSASPIDRATGRAERRSGSAGGA